MACISYSLQETSRVREGATSQRKAPRATSGAVKGVSSRISLLLMLGGVLSRKKTKSCTREKCYTGISFNPTESCGKHLCGVTTVLFPGVWMVTLEKQPLQRPLKTESKSISIDYKIKITRGKLNNSPKNKFKS